MANSDPSLALQAVIRERLIASYELMALVPPDNVLDVTGRPEVMPAVIIGEGQSVFDRFKATTFATLHVWFQEPGLVAAKEAAGAIIDALDVDAQRDGVLRLPGFVVHGMGATRTQFTRDPHGPYSHAIVTVEAIVSPT
ncbi:conserved hypothetical protein [Rhodopseudomonas palustris TIE-1]|uniref:DUF3168 domain-containing protein n=1 Tax=Rhodopseudomonas palustris TaxID=1076 RepID=UPI000164B399|nr:DUF3168 domain-containing protein [Rhodopseudomonas palustris]ACF02481.1 conserved hypothetical protein [Rhodopseudomonas palustris TIE-1]